LDSACMHVVKTHGFKFSGKSEIHTWSIWTIKTGYNHFIGLSGS